MRPHDGPSSPYSIGFGKPLYNAYWYLSSFSGEVIREGDVGIQWLDILAGIKMLSLAWDEMIIWTRNLRIS